MSAYREAARRDGDAEPTLEGPLLTFDVSGRPGEPGRDGASGRDGTFAGERGEAGEDAGPPSPGARGGEIVVELAPSGPTLVQTKAHLTTSRGRTEETATADFSRPAPIALRARGGRGGKGGDGGDGGNGARGRSGSDATRYSSGGDGGPGGDGGSAGSGTSGAQGGDGGQIVVRTSVEDTHLLMLIDPALEGGPGGKAGRNGRLGSGGAGGSGGSSYTWTESETYTDSSGQSQTRTSSHSNSGGSRGFDGRNGSVAVARPAPGTGGRAGRFGIEVVLPGGTIRTYATRYDLRLVSFTHRNDNDDGVYEPGEKGFIGEITVENTGGMPLPTHHDVHVALTRGTWTFPVEDERGAPLTLKVPRGLGPGARHVFREELPFVLGAHRPEGPQSPLAAAETLRLHATLPDVLRSFGSFDTGATEANGKIVVRHPLEIAPLVGLTSLAAGQVTRVLVTLRNVSKKSFGTNGEVARPVALRFGLGYGELGSDDAPLFDEGLVRLELRPEHTRAMPYLEAEGDLTLELRFGISESAAPYTSARLVVACDLAPPDGTPKLRPIHLQELVVRVGRPFDSGDADVLFLVNHRTTREELAAWEGHTTALGASSATWDVSLEDGVGILEKVATGERRFGAVVLLNNATGSDDEEARPASLVPKHLAHALARLGTRMLVVGKTKKLEPWLVPTGDEEGTVVPANAKARTTKAALEALEPGRGHVRLAIETLYLWPWSAETSQDLERKAAALSRWLERVYPSRRYLVVPRYEPTGTRKSAFIRHVASGDLEVRRTVDPGALASRSFPLDEAAVHAADTLNDSRVFFTLICTLSFETKLRLLASSALPCPDHTDALVLALVVDLLAEQAPFRTHPWGAGGLNLPGSLPRLEALGSRAGDVTSDLGKVRLAHVLAWLTLLARERVRFWEWLPPLVWLRRSQALRRRVRRLVRQVEVAHPNEIERSATARSALRETFEADRRDNGTNADVFASTAISNRGLGLASKTDADALEPGSRVMAREEHEKLAALDRKRADAARSGSARAARERADLLDEATCRDLLQGSAEKKRLRVTANETNEPETTTSFGDLREEEATFGRLRQ